MKKIILVTATLIGALIKPEISLAEYGQEVKGESTTEEKIVHKPVETGIEDHLDLVGFGFIATAGAFYLISKKTRVSSEEISL